MREDSYEWRLLKFLNEFGEAILNAWLPKNYAESTMLRSFLGLDKKKVFSEEEQKRLRKKISKTLTRLKKKGLVETSGPRRKTIWRLKLAGKDVVNSGPGRKGLVPEDGRLRIIIFYIAEEEKSYRNWLRTELIAIGFVLLQKSVWIGKRALPEYFIREIFERGLNDNVHIFEIKTGGTLENLNWKNIY